MGRVVGCKLKMRGAVRRSRPISPARQYRGHPCSRSRSACAGGEGLPGSCFCRVSGRTRRQLRPADMDVTAEMWHGPAASPSRRHARGTPRAEQREERQWRRSRAGSSRDALSPGELPARDGTAVLPVTCSVRLSCGPSNGRDRPGRASGCEDAQVEVSQPVMLSSDLGIAAGGR